MKPTTKKWMVGGSIAAVVICAVVIPIAVIFGKGNSEDVLGPAYVEPYKWDYLADSDFPISTLKTFQVDTREQCAEKCTLGCDFFTYQKSTKSCSTKYTDKSSKSQLFIKGQTNKNSIQGMLRWFPTIAANSTEKTPADCLKRCESTADCQYAVVDAYDEKNILCALKKFSSAPGITVGYRTNPRALNYDPYRMGKFTNLGSGGVVAIAASLLPDGKVLLSARPERFKKGPNKETVVRPQVPWGDIATLFDPTTGKFEVVPIDDNIFCHHAVLMADGTVLVAGGDMGDDQAGTGLGTALDKIHHFDFRTKKWRTGINIQRTRWYPSVTRVANGNVFIFGGANNGGDGNFAQASYEIYTDGAATTVYKDSPILTLTGGSWYPMISYIPGSGNIFVFGFKNWAIMSAVDGTEIERETNSPEGYHASDWHSGTVILGLDPANNYHSDFIMFGGAVDFKAPQVAMDTVYHLPFTRAVGAKNWYLDDDRMPYGRVISNAILQPNGKVLLFNGAQLGATGGAPAISLMNASATDVFCFDPYAPAGQRFQIFASSPYQRLYHSSALLLPDGRTMVSGTGNAFVVII